MIELRYSSGSATSNFFRSYPSSSIGGLITSVKIAPVVGDLFGTVAYKDISEGLIDYRGIYLKNTSNKAIKNAFVYLSSIPIVSLFEYEISSEKPIKIGTINIGSFTIDSTLYFELVGEGVVNVYNNELDRLNGLQFAYIYVKQGICELIDNESETVLGTIEFLDIDLSVGDYFEISKVSVQSGFNPTMLNPVPIRGQRYIVPKNAGGDWLKKDGYVAIWSGEKWIYDLPNLMNFEFCRDFDSMPQVLNDVYTNPFGKEFVSANSVDGKSNVYYLGNIEPNTAIPLWIKRTVNKYSLQIRDFSTFGIDINTPFKLVQTNSIFFEGTEMNSFMFVYRGDYNLNIENPQNLVFSLILNELGEADYSKVSIKINVYFQGEYIENKVNIVPTFKGNVYTDFRSGDYVGSFATNKDINEPLSLECEFLDSGIFGIELDLIDLETNESIGKQRFDFNVE